jgi:DHA2 family multidrug resistance protein
MFIYSQFVTEKPLTNLRIFRNRNFAIGCALIFLFGGCIYGAVTVLPLFYQNLMGYSATASGFAVAPRGIGAILAMPLVGFLVAKIDTRILVTFGFTVFGLCSLTWGNLNLQISPTTLNLPIIISGFALGFVFVPLSTISLGGLKPSEIGNGSGLFNLLRNVGGSVGISVVNTILARHEQLHRTELSRNLVPTSHNLQQRLAEQTQFLTHAYGPAEAARRVYGMVESTLNQQAALWSFVDDLRYMALACFCCVPLVWALKRVKPKGPIAAH